MPIVFPVFQRTDGLMQERCNYTANALELHLSCIKPLILAQGDWFPVGPSKLVILGLLRCRGTMSQLIQDGLKKPNHSYHNTFAWVINIKILSGLPRMWIRNWNSTWVRSWNCGCLVTWFCYQLIAKPANKTATVWWPDPYEIHKKSIILKHRMA